MKSKKPLCRLQAKSQTHLTPDKVYDLIEQVYKIPRELLHDPCPAFTPYKAPIFFNGLYGRYKYFNYVNPPFATKILTKFVEKAVEQAEQNHCITIMLCPVKTEQDWFQKYIIPRIDKVHWIKGRLTFKNDKHRSSDPHFLVMID